MVSHAHPNQQNNLRNLRNLRTNSPTFPKPARPEVVMAVVGGLAFLMTMAVLASPADPSDGQLRAENKLILAPGQLISQTFTTLTDGLAAVTVRAGSPDSTADVDVSAGLTVVLRRDGGAGGSFPVAGDLSELGRWHVSASDLRQYTWQTLPLANLSSLPAGQALVLEVSSDKTLSSPLSSPVAVWTSVGNAYPAGALHLAGRPQPVDLAFRVDYRPGRLAKLRWLLQTTGRPPLVAALLLYGVFASSLGVAYTFARTMRTL